MTRILLGVVVCFSLLPVAVSAKDKKTKEEQQAEKSKQSEEKNIARYEKIKEFSATKYQTDADFRESVDAHFDSVMREHSEEAYAHNVSRKSRLVALHEDTWRMHSALYDNLMVQDHINRIGQRLVPGDSERLFAFRVVPDPIPMARSLSTGTIYVSTGMISLLESEAQLAYVLAHEMAHVQMDHWRERSMIELGVEEYNESQQKKAVKIGMLGTLAGGALGGALGQSAGAAFGGAAAGGLTGYLVGSLLNREVKHVAWDKAQEDLADDIAFKTLLGSRYDVREVPRLYMALDKAAAKDSRAQLGFLGERKRVKQRLEKATDLITNAHKADIELKQKAGFLSSSAQHRNLMAELKRDNGILAYYYDMFEMARTNLADAAAIRDNDPAVHYFYGKTLSLVGRTDEDARLAKESFFKATKADSRGQNYGSHLHLALMMAREKGVDPKQVGEELDTYVNNYVRWNIKHNAMTAFPPNLDSIYEYMTMYGGERGWEPKVPKMSEAEIAELTNYRRVSEIATPTVPVEAVAPEPPTAPLREPGRSRMQEAAEKTKKMMGAPAAPVTPTPASRKTR